MAFQYRRPKNFIVKADIGGKGVFVQVHRGDDYDEAARICNFWDEKVNVEFIDNRFLPRDALSVAMRKFDQLEYYIRWGVNKWEAENRGR